MARQSVVEFLDRGRVIGQGEYAVKQIRIEDAPIPTLGEAHSNAINVLCV